LPAVTVTVVADGLARAGSARTSATHAAAKPSVTSFVFVI
jgi:hypothetical protein